MDGLFISVLNMSITCTFIIAVIMLARIPLKRAPKIFSYYLWAVAGLRLLFPLSVSSIFSLLPFKSSPIPRDIAVQAMPHINSGIDAFDNALGGMLPHPTPASSVNPLQVWLIVMAYIWLLGVGLMLIYSIMSTFLLRGRLAGAVNIRGNVYEAENIETPFVIGLLKPKIYLPSGLTDDESLYVILHEQIHIMRKDHIVKALAYFILTVHWFNPFVWAAFVLMVADMEMSCDERVVEELGRDIRNTYSLTLVRMAAGGPILNGSPLAFGEGGIRERIKNILDFKKPSRLTVIIAVLLVIALTVGLALNRENKDTIVEWAPQNIIEDIDEYFVVMNEDQKLVKTEEISVGDSGSNEEIAFAWMDAWFAMFRALPKDNTIYISDGVVDRLEIKKVSKAGLAKAFVFSTTFSVRPTYPIGRNSYWMAGNTGNSPGRDKTWGQMYREVELRRGDDGRYHFVEMGTGGLGNKDEFDYVEETPSVPGNISYPDKGEWDLKFTGFTSAKDGWFVGSPGVAAGMSKNYVYLTHDGGETWEETANVNDEWSRVLTAAAFADVDTGYLCFRYDIENMGRIYQTKDGGETWKQFEITGLSVFIEDGVGEVRNIGFDGNGNGKMEFYFRNKNNQDREGAMQVFVSGDKGETWHILLEKPDVGGVDSPQTIIIKPTGEPYSSAATAAREYYLQKGYSKDLGTTLASIKIDYSGENQDFLDKLKDETVALSVEFSNDPPSHKLREIILTREKGGEWEVIKAGS